MTFGNRCKLPRSATIATFTSRKLNFASALQRRTSHAAIKSSPPPMHHPVTAAMTGFLQSATKLNARWSSPTIARSFKRSAASCGPAIIAPNVPAIPMRSRP